MLLGAVVVRGGERAVTTPWPAEIIEWLVEDGDPVSEGQPLVRIQPKGDPGRRVPPESREGA
jgi:[acyl-carrier-protein] S-malonyltransferase